MKYILVPILAVLFLVQIADFKDPESNKWKIFKQKLDHTSNATNVEKWDQRYYEDETHFERDNGSVFLMIGGNENLENVVSQKTMWIEFAIRYKALCFGLEIRFYGKSHPTKNASLDNMKKYLTPRQTTGDLKYFIVSMNAMKGFKHKKWIAFGGFYGGMLAVVMRLKYPRRVHGAVVSSTPMNPTLDFEQFYDIVKTSLETSSHEESCTQAIQIATSSLKQKLEENNVEIRNDFKLCDKNTDLDATTLFESLSENLASSVLSNNNPFWTGPKIQELCDIMMDKQLKTHLKRLAKVNELIMTANNDHCLMANKEMASQRYQVQQWNDTIVSKGYLQTLFQMCTVNGGFKTISMSTGQLFGSITLSLKEVFKRKCTDSLITNVTLEKFGQKTMEYQQYLRESLNNGQLRNVIFINGDLDPWSAIGSNNENSTTNNVYSINITGVSHCADMYPSVKDSLDLKRTKNEIQNFLEPLSKPIPK